MAIVSIDYTCGCGYHTGKIEEAVKHVDALTHILGVSGIIKPLERKVRPAKASLQSRPRLAPPTSKSAHTAAPVEEREEQVDFSSLRAKLQRRQGM